MEKAQEFESIWKSSAELAAAKADKSAGPTKPWPRKCKTETQGGERRDLSKTQARLEKQVSRAEPKSPYGKRSKRASRNWPIPEPIGNWVGGANFSRNRKLEKSWSVSRLAGNRCRKNCKEVREN